MVGAPNLSFRVSYLQTISYSLGCVHFLGNETGFWENHALAKGLDSGRDLGTFATNRQRALASVAFAMRREFDPPRLHHFPLLAQELTRLRSGLPMSGACACGIFVGTYDFGGGLWRHNGFTYAACRRFHERD